MQNQAGVNPPTVIATATATDSRRNAGPETRNVAMAAAGIAMSEVSARERMLSCRMTARSCTDVARATRTGPTMPHPKSTPTMPRMPIDWPAEKFAQPSAPTMREMTGSMMNGASAERIGAPVKPASLSMSDRIGSQFSAGARHDTSKGGQAP